MFDTFYKTLHSILNNYVPNYKPNTSSNNYPKHILKLKQKVLFKTIHKSNNTFLIWTSLKKALSTQIKQLTINRENSVLSSDNKSYFYKYINSRCASKSNIGPIKSDNNTYLHSDLDKSNILNKQFASVFITDNTIMPILKQSNKESFINNFIFSRHLIRKYLFKLFSYYTLPPDNIPLIIYMLFSFELSIPLTI